MSCAKLRWHPSPHFHVSHKLAEATGGRGFLSLCFTPLEQRRWSRDRIFDWDFRITHGQIRLPQFFELRMLRMQLAEVGSGIGSGGHLVENTLWRQQLGAAIKVAR